MEKDIPRPEYPRPQFLRKDWICLNGEWTFMIDRHIHDVRIQKEQKYHSSNGFEEKIIVPFCPESQLSGLGYKDFMPAVWYQRSLDIPDKWRENNVILNFGAVDFECRVFIDGKLVGNHNGGTVSFSFDITNYVQFGQRHNLVVCAIDDTRSRLQPSGKQSELFYSHGCHYTRTTGIWQSVWIERAHSNSLEMVHLLPDLDHETLTLVPTLLNKNTMANLSVLVYDDNNIINEASFIVKDGLPIKIKTTNVEAWSPSNPKLYDIKLTINDIDGAPIDSVKSYTGFRNFNFKKGDFYLNGEPFFPRFVLDQGFYPDGIWTAPNDKALKKDILLSLEAGFNGARLHQKVFEERFHYWADKLGYLTWGESSSWGCDYNNGAAARNFLTEWSEIIRRDRNHPSIIAWTPFNETWDDSNLMNHNRTHTEAYDICKSLDPTRPVATSSGGFHISKTDIWTEHLYTQDPETFFAELNPKKEKMYIRHPKTSVSYKGQPYMLDEFGGTRWHPKAGSDSWGYGEDPDTLEDLYARLEGLIKGVMKTPYIKGFCYTQLTDVEQEQNGIYFYDRTTKFDMERIRSIFSLEIIQNTEVI